MRPYWHQLFPKNDPIYPSDLNNDGFLTYNDFLWAKDKICYMSGWKIDSPKYKITEALFHEIWDSLVQIADMDKDGKITKKEWVRPAKKIGKHLDAEKASKNCYLDHAHFGKVNNDN